MKRTVFCQAVGQQALCSCGEEVQGCISTHCSHAVSIPVADKAPLSLHALLSLCCNHVVMSRRASPHLVALQRSLAAPAARCRRRAHLCLA